MHVTWSCCQSGTTWIDLSSGGQWNVEIALPTKEKRVYYCVTAFGLGSLRTFLSFSSRTSCWWQDPGISLVYFSTFRKRSRNAIGSNPSRHFLCLETETCFPVNTPRSVQDSSLNIVTATSVSFCLCL